MRRIFVILFCFSLTSSLLAQEKYTVPDIRLEEKFDRILGQFWGIFATSVDFAKSQGITPYDYGKYLGKVFAPTWNKDAGFEGLVRGTLYNWENFKRDEDGKIQLQEMDDGSVVISVPRMAWDRYFSENFPPVSFKETMECMQGVSEEIATHLSAEIKQKITDEEIIFVLKKQ
jgi:hypothetical protein